MTGIVLTKLDGTAKGGIALAIADELGMPVKLIGIGEQLEDLRPFDAGRLRARAGLLRRRRAPPSIAARNGRLGHLDHRRRACSASARCSRELLPRAVRASARLVAALVAALGGGHARLVVVFLVVSSLLLLDRAPDRALAPAAAAAIAHRHRGADRAARDRARADRERRGRRLREIDGEVWTARAYDEDDVIDEGARVAHHGNPRAPLPSWQNE